MTKKTQKSTPQKNKVVKQPEMWWIRGSAEMCEFFGITAQTLSNWVKKGCPQEGYGKYDLQKIIHWKYADDAYSAEARRAQAEASLKEAKAGQETIKLAIAEGRFIATDDVTKDLRRLFTVLRRILTSIGHDVATEINVLDPQAALAAKKVIDDAIHNALTQLANEGSAQHQENKMA